MSVVPYAFTAETALDLESEFNARLAPLLNSTIFDIELDQVEPGPFYAKNLYAAFTTDVGAAITDPFVFKTFSQPTTDVALIKVLEFIAANPTYFFSGIYVVYRPRNPNPNEGVIIGIFYNVGGAGAAVNWGGATIATGAVGGDLSGLLPNPTVVGIQNTPVDPGPYAAGTQLTYNPDTGTFQPYVVQVYGTLAAAAANQAAQIIGQQIIVVPGTSDAGTYVLNVKTGNIADYTKVSDLTDLASEVLLDAPIPGLAAVNVYQALQELAASDALSTGVALAAATTDMASVALAAFASVKWEFTFQRGTVRYSGTMQANHDGTTPYWTVYGVVGTSLPFDVSVQCIVSGGNLILQAVNAGLACDYRVRTRGMPT